MSGVDQLLAALERRRHAQARHAHPYPQLIPRPSWFCDCGEHLAHEGAGIPTRCPVCIDIARRGT